MRHEGRTPHVRFTVLTFGTTAQGGCSVSLPIDWDPVLPVAQGSFDPGEGRYGQHAVEFTATVARVAALPTERELVETWRETYKALTPSVLFDITFAQLSGFYVEMPFEMLQDAEEVTFRMLAGGVEQSWKRLLRMPPPCLARVHLPLKPPVDLLAEDFLRPEDELALEMRYTGRIPEVPVPVTLYIEVNALLRTPGQPAKMEQ